MLNENELEGFFCLLFQEGESLGGQRSLQRPLTCPGQI